MCKEQTFCLFCHGNLSKTEASKPFEARKHLIAIATDKPFVQAVATINVLKNHSKLFSFKKKILPLRYELKLITYAMNELLGRPVPSVLNPNHLFAMLAEARVGNFTRLDQILGFASTDTKENVRHEMEQAIKVNNIMHNILKAKGLNYAAIIDESAKIRKVSMELRSIQRDENGRKEKKQKITKMKLNNQRKLGAIKTAPPKSDPVDDQEKRCNDGGKIKTAKDHEHYRKSKRLTRI